MNGKSYSKILFVLLVFIGSSFLVINKTIPVSASITTPTFSEIYTTTPHNKEYQYAYFKVHWTVTGYSSGDPPYGPYYYACLEEKIGSTWVQILYTLIAVNPQSYTREIYVATIDPDVFYRVVVRKDSSTGPIQETGSSSDKIEILSASVTIDGAEYDSEDTEYDEYGPNSDGTDPWVSGTSVLMGLWAKDTDFEGSSWAQWTIYFTITPIVSAQYGLVIDVELNGQQNKGDGDTYLKFTYYRTGYGTLGSIEYQDDAPGTKTYSGYDATHPTSGSYSSGTLTGNAQYQFYIEIKVRAYNVTFPNDDAWSDFNDDNLQQWIKIKSLTLSPTGMA